MSSLTEQDLRDYVELIGQKFGVRVVEKKTSKLMKLLSIILFFNRGFMISYVTTIGKTVYWPDLESIWRSPSNLGTMMHETQHAHDGSRFKVIYELFYLLPQILGILAVLAFLAILLGPWWLLPLVMLLAALPIPSWGRMFWEVRGDACGIAYRVWIAGEVRDDIYESMAKSYTTSAYYFMWPFKKNILKRLRAKEANIRAGKLTEVLRVSYEFFSSRGLVKS